MTWDIKGTRFLLIFRKRDATFNRWWIGFAPGGSNWFAVHAFGHRLVLHWLTKK